MIVDLAMSNDSSFFVVERNSDFPIKGGLLGDMCGRIGSTTARPFVQDQVRTEVSCEINVARLDFNFDLMSQH